MTSPSGRYLVVALIFWGTLLPSGNLTLVASWPENFDFNLWRGYFMEEWPKFAREWIYIYIKKNKKENMETLTKGLTITNVVFNSKL